jgi:VanZ family protein
VAVLALLPVEHLQLPVFSWWDKAQHALAFAALTGSALWLWDGKEAQVVAGMIAYGGAIELAQWTVGWRFAEWADFGADTLGVAVAYAAMSVAKSFDRAGRDTLHSGQRH